MEYLVKEARKWNDLTLQEQRLYLRKHPGSRRRLTAKPRTEKVNFDEIVGSKRIVSGIAKLNRLVDKVNKNGIRIPRAKISWVLEKALKDGRQPQNNLRTYDINENTFDKDKMQKAVRFLNRRINKIVSASDRIISNSRAPKQTTQAIDNYIKQSFVVLKDAKPVKNVKEMKEFTAPKATVKKTSAPDHITVGDRVRLNNGVEGTITAVSHGHKYLTVKLTTDDGKHWHSKQREWGYRGSSLKYLGKTSKKDAERIVKTRRDFDAAIQNQNQRRVDEGRKNIDLMKISVGDTVMIRGSHYNWPAKVVQVDHRKGGVRIDQVRTRRQRGRGYMGFGFGFGGPTTQHYRFIPATSIVSSKRS